MQATDLGYKNFLSSFSARHWQRIGLKRRGGVNVPLFSIYSKQSIGIGDFRDLCLLIDWCTLTKMSIIQLLPLNDVGYSFMPYDAQSTFALEPLYLCLDELQGIEKSSFQSEKNDLKKQFAAGSGRVNYMFKKPKMQLLQTIFSAIAEDLPPAFWKFQKKEAFWLRDHALFQCLKASFEQRAWYQWSEEFKRRDPKVLENFEKENEKRILFFEWLQWQLFEQLSSAKSYASKKEVLLMGDLPFLVSRDSSDVWANQSYFKLNLEAGAPPDAYIADGQRWGMPPYQWNEIEKRDYDYLANKVRYGSFFYDLLRIDHVVGMFRLWTIHENEPRETGGKNGVFDPQDEAKWEEHGRKLLTVMTEKGEMLCCAEDLGVVPECSNRVLNEFAIPGMDIQRWTRDWNGDQHFVRPENYRKCSVTMISTHDMPHFLGWWLCEVSSIKEETLRHFCDENNFSFENVRNRFFDAEHEGFFRWKIREINRLKILKELNCNESQIKWFLDLFDRAKKDYELFLKFLDIVEEKCPEDILRAALVKANESASIFSIQFIQDWLALGGFYNSRPWSTRMNMPGTVKDENWSLTLPISVEEMLEFEENQKIKAILKNSGRAD